MNSFDADHYFSLMRKTRAEVKKSVPFKTRAAHTSKPLALALGVAAAQSLAALHQMINRTLSVALLETPAQRIGVLVDHALTRFAKQLITDVPHAARQRFIQVDQEIVQDLKQQGFLPTNLWVNVREMPDKDIKQGGADVGPQVAFDDNQITMVSMADGLEKICTLRSSNVKSAKRWMTLLHEVAHLVFNETVDRFAPTLPLSEDSQKYINDFLVHRVNGDRSHLPQFEDRINTPERFLSEAFADCYGAMMLLALTNDSPAANDVVKEFYHNRVHHRFMGENGGYGAVMLEEHFTDFAMEEMLSHKNTWISAAPHIQKALAFQYASNGLLRLADLQRTNNLGERIGMGFNGLLTNAYKHVPQVLPSYLAFCQTYGLENGDVLFRQSFTNHTCEASINAMLDIYKTAMDDILTVSPQDPLSAATVAKRAVNDSRWENYNRLYIADNTHTTALHKAFAAEMRQWVGQTPIAPPAPSRLGVALQRRREIGPNSDPQDQKIAPGL